MRTTVIATATFFCLALPAQATVWTFNNFMDGAHETPPEMTPATGSVTALLNDVTGQMNVSGTYQNLLDVAGDAHVHCCVPEGMPGLVLILLPTTGGTSGTFSGGAVLDSVHVQLVLDGMSYLNVHSAFASGGEIRGQLVNPVAPNPPGDFNGDGHVDAADYVTWRKDKDVIYGDVDYGTWRAHFGQSAGGGTSIVTAAVAEPAACVMLVISGLPLLASRRRVRCSVPQTF